MDEQQWLSSYEGHDDTDRFEDRKQKIMDTIDSFEGAPFTIQRIVEVLDNPSKVFSNTRKLLNGLDKLVSVSSLSPEHDIETGDLITCDIDLSSVEQPVDKSEKIELQDTQGPETPCSSRSMIMEMVPRDLGVGNEFTAAPWAKDSSV